jgi:RNA polymerase sigma factor (sigma-70 family)
VDGTEIVRFRFADLAGPAPARVAACNPFRSRALYLLPASWFRVFDAASACPMKDSADGQSFAAAGGASDPPALPPGAEAELVLRARTEPAAFGELYEAHYSAILDYLYRRTLSVAVAEELTSDTFFKALRGLAGYEPRRGVRFRSWLYRIATNEARMYWRGRKGRGGGRGVLPLLDGEDLGRVTFVWPATESAEGVRERRRQFARVHEALRGLSEPYQAVIVLRYFEGLGYEEIAGILGKRPGTIKSLVHRGLAKLGKAMAGMDATR